MYLHLFSIVRYMYVYMLQNGPCPAEYVIPQLPQPTVLVQSGADCTEDSCSSNIGCNF